MTSGRNLPAGDTLGMQLASLRKRRGFSQRSLAARLGVAPNTINQLETKNRGRIETLDQVLDILHADLVRKFGIGSPRILVTGLNPHAGENGYLGREEIDVITPVLEEARNRGIVALGCFFY